MLVTLTPVELLVRAESASSNSGMSGLSIFCPLSRPNFGRARLNMRCRAKQECKKGPSWRSSTRFIVVVVARLEGEADQLSIAT